MTAVSPPRPRLGRRVVRGLRGIDALAAADLDAMTTEDAATRDVAGASVADMLAAIVYVRELARWAQPVAQP